MLRMAVRICENGHEVTDDGLFYCTVCRSVDLRPVGEPTAESDPVSRPVPGPAPRPAPGAAARSRPQALTDAEVEAIRRSRRRDDARDRLQKVGLWGVGLYVLGAIIWAVALSEHDDLDSGGGAAVGIFLGAITASVGAAMVLVFLIGWGVKLGREAADV